MDVLRLATEVALSRHGVELARHARCAGSGERRRERMAGRAFPYLPLGPTALGAAVSKVC